MKKNNTTKLIEQLDELRSAAANKRTIAHLLSAHDSSLGIPLDLSVWSHIGSLIENWGSEIVELSRDIEKSLLHKNDINT